MADLAKVTTKDQWIDLIEAVAAGRVSMMDVMRDSQPESGDYPGHVHCARAFHMLMQDSRILKRLSAELTETIKASGENNPGRFEAAVVSKDGTRRFQKLTRLKKEMTESGPSLLNGATFEECLAQYLKIMAHLEQLWIDSTDLYRRSRYPLATFTAILLIEEMGKIGRLWHELLTYDTPRSTTKELSSVGKDHRQKGFIALVTGALVNARLDRILGIKTVRQALQDAESGKLERIRQSCLYVDYVDGTIKTPGERINQQQAQFFVVLAGEIWAETYGHFPFEFERMIERVSAFEAELGYTHEQIHGRPEHGA